MIWASASMHQGLASLMSIKKKFFLNLQDNVRISVCQQDKDPKHKSKFTTEWLQEKQNGLFGVAKSEPTEMLMCMEREPYT